MDKICKHGVGILITKSTYNIPTPYRRCPKCGAVGPAGKSNA